MEQNYSINGSINTSMLPGAMVLMYRGPCLGKPQYISTMAHSSPFRKCSYCGEHDKPYERDRRLRRRAWTQFQVTRKFCCPNCEQKGREDERKARLLILRRDRLLAEPVAQYQRIKVNYPDALLIFRVGDQYTAFGDDAIKLNSLLGLQLIISQHAAPFTQQCTFPYSSLEDYLPRMVRAGHRIALCDKFEGVSLPSHSESENEGDAVPSIACEPYDDPPFCKTHRIRLRGQEEQFDVHLMEGMYYALEGSWGVLTTDWRVEVLMTYRAEYVAHSDLSMVADKPTRYEKNENAKLASKLKMVVEILQRYGALPSPRLGMTYVPRDSQINWELKLPEITQHLALHEIEVKHGHLVIRFGTFRCTFGAEHITDLLRYYSQITSGRNLAFKLPPCGAPSRAIGNFTNEENRQLTLAIAEENMATSRSQPYSTLRTLSERHLKEVQERIASPLPMDYPPTDETEVDEELDDQPGSRLDQYEHEQAA